jgi:hypothetical protein
MAKLQALLLTVTLGAVACDGSIGDTLGLPTGGQASGPSGPGATGAGGSIGGTGTGGPGGSGGGPMVDRLADPTGLGFIAMERLSKREYQQSLTDLLGIAPPTSLSSLPEDIEAPYDNDYASQVASAVLIAGLSDVAREATTTALSTAAGRAALVPCTPTGPSDAACLTKFIQSFGRRTLHRPVSTDEVTEYLSLQTYAVQRNDFYAGVALVMRAMLQDIEFAYRVEIGTPVSAGLVKLTPYELANRASFTLLGAPPSNALLDAAAMGQLDTDAGMRTAAQGLLTDPKAVARASRFHAQWLNYDHLQVDATLAASMRAESDALISKVLFESKSAYSSLFTWDEAFVDATMAPIYGLPAPGAPAWTKLTDPNRRGILGEASFLAGGAKFGDTSPVLRGLQIRSRLMCQYIPPPPPTVNVDKPPAGSATDCKATRYANHRANPCATCHALLDPAGNGLEQYGANGSFRSVENGRPDCPIDGHGTLDGATFMGPAGLANALIPTGDLENCAMQQLFQYVVGRTIMVGGTISAADQGTIASLSEAFAKDQHHYPDVLTDLVSSVAFRHRVTEIGP